MPITKFRCPSGQFVDTKVCLAHRGCVEKQRCALIPYLRAVSENRPWKGLSPSRAGTGPRKIFLEQTTDYAVDPDGRAWAMHGIGVHSRLALHKYNENVMAETPLSDEKMQGVADSLLVDEDKEGFYMLADFKTWGSFKVAKAQGIIKVPETILDDGGKPARYKKDGKKGKKGDIKTRQVVHIDPTKIDLKAEEYQLNRYRIFFEKLRFPISKMWIQVLTRDGKTVVAYGRGVMRAIYMIPIRRLPDEEVLSFYATLNNELQEAFKVKYARPCNNFENWGSRRCTPEYCEPYLACQKMGER